MLFNQAFMRASLCWLFLLPALSRLKNAMAIFKSIIFNKAQQLRAAKNLPVVMSISLGEQINKQYDREQGCLIGTKIKAA